MFIVFALAAASFFTINDLYLQIYDSTWRGLFSSKSDTHESKKIFIIGSSSVYSINSTFVQNYLEQNNLTYQVYDLAEIGRAHV